MAIEFNRREILLGSLAAGMPSRLTRRQSQSRIKLGLVTYNVAKDWSLDTILKTCGAAGLDGVEFRTTHAHGVEPTLDFAKRKEIKQELADSGLKQISLGSVCEFHSADPSVVRQHVETCRQFVDLAKDIGAKGVKVRPNGLPRETPPERTFDQIGRSLSECGKYASDHGVEIWVEVHGSGTSLPSNMRKIMDRCGHPAVGITWNSNATDLIGESVREGFDLLRPFIKCCHINDLWSGYPYRELFSLLNKAGYDGFTLIECGFTIKPEDGVPFLKCYKALWKELNQ
jgi:sugar phosphate isomerase/epimerase